MSKLSGKSVFSLKDKLREAQEVAKAPVGAEVAEEPKEKGRVKPKRKKANG